MNKAQSRILGYAARRVRAEYNKKYKGLKNEYDLYNSEYYELLKFYKSKNVSEEKICHHKKQ